MASHLLPTLLLLLLLLLLSATSFSFPTPNYSDALAKSLLFFQGQRSGNLPTSQKVKWRGSSGLSDGQNENVDLSGGYYDAGDNVKFNFPMAYTTTILSWAVLDYGGRMGAQLKEAREAIKWATDYLLNCTSHLPQRLYVGVTSPVVDHPCWFRPEDMPPNQPVFFVSPQTPGSDVAGEIAAALAAASIVFRRADNGYSNRLLAAATKTMYFAQEYLGSYSSGNLNSVTCPYYCSYSGYQDELRWGAAWLFRATNKPEYYDMVKRFPGAGDTDLFSWDRKDAGTRVLLSRRAILNKDKNFLEDKSKAEEFICKILPTSPTSSTRYTQGGLMYKLQDNNLQYVTSITFLLTTYAKYMGARNVAFSCGSMQVTSSTLKALAKRQVDYILGVNPLGMSYMVGFGKVYPQRIHHRASSIPSVTAHPQSIGCDAGFQYYYSASPNPNIHVGAVVGGPDQSDGFSDSREDFEHTEPTTYINAALVGPLAYFCRSSS